MVGQKFVRLRCSMKTSRDISKFVLRYSEQDEKLIRLKSNGLLGQYFVDENQAFRDAVIEVVLKTQKAVPVILLRDLFRALTESALHAWSLGIVWPGHWQMQ